MSEDRGSQFDDRPALDRAIDAAVREMVGIEPRAGLRARVLRRIEGNETASAGAASAFRRKVLWTGVPLAAAATLNKPTPAYRSRMGAAVVCSIT